MRRRIMAVTSHWTVSFEHFISCAQFLLKSRFDLYQLVLLLIKMPKLRSFKMIVRLKECAKKFIFCSRIYQWCIYKSKCLCFMHQSAPACQYLEALTLLSESYGSSEKCFQTTGIFLVAVSLPNSHCFVWLCFTKRAWALLAVLPSFHGGSEWSQFN